MSHSEPANKFLTLKEVAALIGCSPWTVRRNVGKSIPEPVSISPKIKRWRASDIEQMMRGNYVPSNPN